MRGDNQDPGVEQRPKTYLGNFTQSSPFLSEVNDDTTATVLGLFDGLLDTEDEIRPARADIRAEDVAPVALPSCERRVIQWPPERTASKTHLVMNAQCQFLGGIGHGCRISETVHSETADWWQKHLDVRACYQLHVLC